MYIVYIYTQITTTIMTTMKRSKRIELTENTIKIIAKKAIDKGTKFKPYVESILEKLANNHDKKTTQRHSAS